MKYNKSKFIKIASCIFFFLFFVLNVSKAQQTVPNTNSSFINGTILSSKNGTRRAELKMSDKSYDEYMVGVYFDNLMVENSAMLKVKPLTSGGITYVRFNNENGQIVSGDPITSSATPGVAMKATESGIILGVALEDADSAGELLKIRVMIQYLK
jgi:hypothetical protein